MRFVLREYRLPALLLLACLGFMSEVRGEDGISIDLPVAGRKNTSGLKVNIDTRWVNTNGYRPVRFTLATSNASPSNTLRKIQVVIRAGAEGAPVQSSRGAMTVRDELVLSEGASTHTQVVLVPQRTYWGSMKVEFFEDGYPLRDLEYAGPTRVVRAGWNQNWTESSPGVLIIDRDTPPRPDRDAFVAAGRETLTEAAVIPDVQQLADLLPVYNYSTVNVAVPANPGSATPSASNALASSSGPGKQTGDLGRLLKLQNLERIHVLPFEELPVEVLGYSCFDLIILSEEDARALASQSPERWRAMMDWIRAGASLIVFGVDAGETGTSGLEKLVGLPSGGDVWNEAEFSARNSENVVAEKNAGYYRNTQPVSPNANSEQGDSESASAAEASDASSTDQAAVADFRWRPLGLGRLFALPNPDPFASKLPWAWILNTISSDQNWFERYGMSMHRSNSGFWNFLVRGVGRPPVVWFLLLISVFMIVAGPVNYLMLRSRGKLALLLVTVPAGSFIVTICLLAYSLLSDGLGVQWRCRSVTVLDSSRGTAVSWSRHSYFAGLAPRSGLDFPRDAAVYPLEFDPTESLGQFGAARAVTWSGTQRLQSGYLSSRTPTQFLVVRSGECDARLEVREGSAAQQPPQVVNNLGVVIRGMVLRDSRGDLWRPDGNSEAGAQLVHATEEEARAYLREKLQPWILDTNAMAVAPVNSYRWSAVAVDPYSQVAPDTSSSMLEEKIKEFHSAARLDALRPRSWVAIVDRSPHVVPGVAKVEAQDDLHLILGSY